MSETQPLRILHVTRAPVGGLFRHVADLCRAQAAAGHAVGIICDSFTGGPFEERILAGLKPVLGLGLKRIPMRREIALSDLASAWRVLSAVQTLRPHVLHGHGAKGGAFARLIGTLLRPFGARAVRIYCPHGGSLHYDPASWAGWLYFRAERMLEWMTDALVFVSRYEADAYAAKVGEPRRPVTIARNGIRPDEFEPVVPAPDASDFLYIGVLRDLKGPDVFIRALPLVAARIGRAPASLIVGAGDDRPRYERLARELGLRVTFRDPMPAREAFALARAVVVPSRAESMPYIVLETLAAGVPLVATRVGGIPEIFAEESDRLVPPGDAEALALAMAGLILRPHEARAASQRLREAVRRRFSIEAMAAAIDAAYRAAGAYPR